METTLSPPLLPRVARGDASAVEECLDRYGGLVWSLARRLSPSSADAEDAAQEIFIDLWKSADRFREEAAAEATFVALIARRRLIDRRRRLERRPDVRPLESFHEPETPDATRKAELADDAAKAIECLEGLREDERRVLELSVYQGLPQSRIAESTGLALGTVKTHARRGLLELRDCMEAGRPQRGRKGGTL